MTPLDKYSSTSTGWYIRTSRFRARMVPPISIRGADRQRRLRLRANTACHQPCSGTTLSMVFSGPFVGERTQLHGPSPARTCPHGSRDHLGPTFGIRQFRGVTRRARSRCGQRRRAAQALPISHRPRPADGHRQLVDGHVEDHRKRAVRRLAELHGEHDGGDATDDHRRYVPIPMEGIPFRAVTEHPLLLPHLPRQYRSARDGSSADLPEPGCRRVFDAILLCGIRRLGRSGCQREQSGPGEPDAAGRQQRRSLRPDHGRHRVSRRDAAHLWRPLPEGS